MNSKFLPLISLLLVLAGPPLYAATMENRLARSTAWPTLALMTVGTVLGFVAAARRSGRWPKVVAGINVTLLALIVVAFFVLMRLPRSEQFADASTAPDFSLSDHNGRQVNLRQELAKGPVLLVFYRGHW